MPRKGGGKKGGAAKAPKASSTPAGALEGTTGSGFDTDELHAHVAGEFGITEPPPEEEPPPEPVTPPEEPLTLAPDGGLETPPPTPDPPPEPTPPPAEPPEPPIAAEPAPEPTPEPPVEPAPSEPPPVEPAPLAPSEREAFVHDLSKIRAKLSEAQQELYQFRNQAPPQPAYPPPVGPPPVPGQPYVPPGPPPPYDPAQTPPPQEYPAPHATTGVAVPVSDDGRPTLPEGPAAQEWLRRNTPQPTQADLQAQEVQELNQMRSSFVAADPRRAQIVERLDLARQILDNKTMVLLQQTGESPRSLYELTATIERHGLGDEFRQYMPEVSKEELPEFIDSVFRGSNATRLAYASKLCERVLTPPPPPPTPGVQPTPERLPQPLPPAVPPRIAAEGVATPTPAGVPAKQERMDALATKQRADPFNFTREEEATLQQLRQELGFGMI